MQHLHSGIIGKPIMSITGAEILGIVTGIVIKPQSLHMIACELKVPMEKAHQYLLFNDIRYFNNQKILVNDKHAISEYADLVRYQDDIDNNYQLVGKRVQTVSGKRLGKVTNFVYDAQHFFVCKLHVAPTLFKSLLITKHIIDRNDIIETKPRAIIVKDSLASIKKTTPSILPQRS